MKFLSFIFKKIFVCFQMWCFFFPLRTILFSPFYFNWFLSFCWYNFFVFSFLSVIFLLLLLHTKSQILSKKLFIIFQIDWHFHDQRNEFVVWKNEGSVIDGYNPSGWSRFEWIIDEKTSVDTPEGMNEHDLINLIFGSCRNLDNFLSK